jgi:hypothetical protein
VPARETESEDEESDVSDETVLEPSDSEEGDAAFDKLGAFVDSLTSIQKQPNEHEKAPSPLKPTVQGNILSIIAYNSPKRISHGRHLSISHRSKFTIFSEVARRTTSQ